MNILQRLLYRFIRRQVECMMFQSHCEGIRKGWNLHSQYIKAMAEQRAIYLSMNPVEKEIQDIMDNKRF